MIRDLKTEQDPQSGFPIVSWEEDRPLFHGAGAVRIACFIEPDPTTGALLFAALDSDGKKLQGRPWALLKTFAVTSEQVLRSQSARAVLEVLAKRSKSGWGQVLISGGQVIVAQFDDSKPFVPMYLNLADASQAEMAEVHDVLNREFRILRDAEGGYIDRYCAERFQWRRTAQGTFLPFNVPPLKLPSRSPMRWWEPVVAIAIFAAVIVGAVYFFRSY